MVVKAGLKEKHRWDIPVSGKKVVGGQFFAYFVNIIYYRGMKEGWKDGRNHGIICGHSMLPPYHMTSGKIIKPPHYHNAHSRCGSGKITAICQPELALHLCPGLSEY